MCFARARQGVHIWTGLHVSSAGACVAASRMGRGRDVPEGGEASGAGGSRISHSFVRSWEGGGLRDEAIRELREASHIVSSIPPAGDSDPVLDCYRENLNKWAGYMSSTSVYGDWQGEFVDEETEPRPVEKRAVARWEAEKQWMRLALETGACVRVFRLGGIYGPGRSALDTVRSRNHSASQRLREQKRWTSRVHVADICQVIVKAMTECTPGARVYNVVDDDPSPRSEVMAYARRLLNVEVDDRFLDQELSALLESPSTTTGQVSEKRVSNRRVKSELQIELFYPTFRSGLEAIAVASNHRFD